MLYPGKISQMDKTKKECYGCLELFRKDVQCIINVVDGEEKCPCAECLVKMICSNPCEEFRKEYEMCSVTNQKGVPHATTSL